MDDKELKEKIAAWLRAKKLVGYKVTYCRLHPQEGSVSLTLAKRDYSINTMVSLREIEE